MSDTPSILPGNATPLERNLEKFPSRLSEAPDPIQRLWDAEECPEHILPYLAWALSVEEWQDSWSIEQRRQVVLDAIGVHRRKGTVGAVRKSLESLGFTTDLTEWFEYDGEPHTFRVDAYAEEVFGAGGRIDQGLFDQVFRVVDHVKPVRSHFRLRIGESFKVQTTAKVGIRQRKRHDQTLSPKPRVHEVESCPVLKPGMRQRSQHRQTLAPHPCPHELRPTSVAKSGLRQRQRHGATLTIIPREGAAYAK